MRPPYGAITDDIRNGLDLSFIMWDVDSLDWKSKNETAILTEIQRQVRNGSIILMHDIHGPSVNFPELLNSRLKAHEIYYDRDQ